MKQTTINQRIKTLIHTLELKDIDFARKVNIKPKTINLYTDSNTNPSAGKLRLICEAYPKLNPVWLLLGKGEMWLASESENLVNELKENYNSSIIREKDKVEITQQLDILKDQLNNINEFHLSLAKSATDIIQTIENKLK
jgi:hypothetical protein